MRTKQPFLLIPVENQVRELDAKLLLICVAAQRGFISIIGPKSEVESRIASLPRSVYVAKSMVQGNSKFLRIARELGHTNVAWDEEALVHLPPATYFSRRFSPEALANVSHLFAWGEDNAELWRQYPELPAEIAIHVTGNPRCDLLRPAIRPYYEEAVNEIRSTYGDFILINTNFNHVNAFLPGRNLFQPAEQPGAPPRFGRAARGMTREYAEGLRKFKQSIFEAFQDLIPALENAFPEYTLVVRPHPTENQDIYKQIADRCRRVKVTNEGNVVPWLMAAKALIHNGCTTGVEAYVLGVPAISYRATIDETYDLGFYALPNQLSHQCFDFAQVQQTLKQILKGEIGAADGAQRLALIDRHLSGHKGPLACERIIDAIETFVGDRSGFSGQQFWRRLGQWSKATKRSVRQRLNIGPSPSDKSLAFQRHKYPEISIEEVRSRIAQFQKILGKPGDLEVERIYTRLFRIRARS